MGFLGFGKKRDEAEDVFERVLGIDEDTAIDPLLAVLACIADRQTEEPDPEEEQPRRKFLGLF